MEVNFENLPKQEGFAIDIQELELWDYVPNSKEFEGPIPVLNYAFRSDSLDVIYMEIPPGGVLPWHTHEAHTAQLYWMIEGVLKTNYKDNEGKIHSKLMRAQDKELIYLPAGAHNQLENPSDNISKAFSFKEGGGAIIGRIEHIVGNKQNHYDPKSLPSPGLDILPRKGVVLDSQQTCIEDW
jgi:mannose-6-phosphate isomerase-like protein (cupin superfamily)